MNVTIYQTFHINSIKVDNLSNSAVLQIGTAGHIQSYSTTPLAAETTVPILPYFEPIVPLPNPT